MQVTYCCSSPRTVENIASGKNHWPLKNFASFSSELPCVCFSDSWSFCSLLIMNLCGDHEYIRIFYDIWNTETMKYQNKKWNTEKNAAVRSDFEELTRLQFVGLIFSSLKNPLKVLLLEDIQYQTTVTWYENVIFFNHALMYSVYDLAFLCWKRARSFVTSEHWIQSLIAWCTSRALLLCPCLSQLIRRWSWIVNYCEAFFFFPCEGSVQLSTCI